MANSLIRSNRRPIQPETKAKIADFDANTKPNDKQKQSVDSVTFDTNLKINNHIRNQLKAMAVLGHADNQKVAVEVAISSFLETLTSSEKKEIEFQIRTLEKRDSRQKGK